MGFHVAHVFKTTNAGATWSDWSGSGGTALPDAPVNALLVDAPSATIYAGTDVGVFMSSTASASWTEVGVPSQPGGQPGYLPNVPVTAIQMYNNAGTKQIRVSTYGRGIWEYALAVAPDYANAIFNSPQTIFPGQAATFNGKLTAFGGYASPVNLSCTGTAPTTCALNPTQATPTATYSVTAGGAVGDYNFNVHAVGTDAKTITHDAPAALHVVDFGLTAPNPNALTVQQGGTSNASTFQVTAAGSFSGTVNLSCSSELPSGAACQFSPSNAVKPTASSPVTVTLTVTAAADTPAGGPSTITLAANVTGAPAAKTQTFTLTVTAPVPDFSLAVTETPNTTVASQNVTWNGTLTAINGYNSSVNLSCVGAAPETCTLNPASLKPTPTGAAFTVTVGSAIAAAFNFGIQGTDGTLTHSQPASLTVGTDVTWTDTGSSSATAQAGEKATYTFSAEPLGGGTFTGVVGFACANLPALTSCNFSPASIVAGAGITPVAVTIVTTGPNQGKLRTGAPSSPFSVPREDQNRLYPRPLAWLLAIPLGGMWLAGLGRRRATRRNLFVAFCVVTLAGLALLVACGGLAGGGGGGGGITVTVSQGAPPSVYPNSAGWPSQTAQFTATVTGASNTAVSWAVTTTGGGTIDANGLYTAPAAVAGLPATVTIAATSQADTTKSGTNYETLNPVTIPGSYSGIQVTATAAGGAAHTEFVTLTVQ
jgi:hypothetical protein